MPLHGPTECPRTCTLCDGHHCWLEGSVDWDDPVDAAENAEIPLDDPRRSLECWFVCRHCDAWIDCEDVWAVEARKLEDEEPGGEDDFDDEDESATDLEERLDNALRGADGTQKGGG